MSTDRDGSNMSRREILVKLGRRAWRSFWTFNYIFLPLLVSQFLFSNDHIYIPYLSSDDKTLIKKSIEYVDNEISSEKRPIYFDYVRSVMNDEGHFFYVSPKCIFLGCEIFDNETSSLFNTMSYLQNVTISRIIECLKKNIPADKILWDCQVQYEIFGSENDMKEKMDSDISEMNDRRKRLLSVFQEFRSNGNHDEKQILNIKRLNQIISISKEILEGEISGNFDEYERSLDQHYWSEINKLAIIILENQQVRIIRSKNIGEVIFHIFIKSLVISVVLHIALIQYGGVREPGQPDRSLPVGGVG